jgi:uncharacterized protein YbcI
MEARRASPPGPLGKAAATISTESVQVLRDYTGRGPTKARTTINEDHVTIVLADTLTRGEQTLVDSGDEARVLDLRAAFQEAMRAELVGLVERVVGRKVAAFMSTNHIDPDLAVEVFVLEPEEARAS